MNVLKIPKKTKGQFGGDRTKGRLKKQFKTIMMK